MVAPFNDPPPLVAPCLLCHPKVLSKVLNSEGGYSPSKLATSMSRRPTMSTPNRTGRLQLATIPSAICSSSARRWCAASPSATSHAAVPAHPAIRCEQWQQRGNGSTCSHRRVRQQRRAASQRANASAPLAPLRSSRLSLLSALRLGTPSCCGVRQIPLPILS